MPCFGCPRQPPTHYWHSLLTPLFSSPFFSSQVKRDFSDIVLQPQLQVGRQRRGVVICTAAQAAGRARSEVAPTAICLSVPGHYSALTSSVPNSPPPHCSQDHVRSLAALTANVKRHGAPFRHMLFYGERRHAVCWGWLLLVGWLRGSIAEHFSAACSSALRGGMLLCMPSKCRSRHGSCLPLPVMSMPAARHAPNLQARPAQVSGCRPSGHAPLPFTLCALCPPLPPCRPPRYRQDNGGQAAGPHQWHGLCHPQRRRCGAPGR